MNALYALGSVFIVSLVSFVGILFLSLKEDKLKKYTSIFISLAVGALLGGAFIHIIPESFESFDNSSSVGILIIIGILIFFILEKVLHWHHHGEDKEKKHIHPVGKLILLSDGVHNFVDGLIIGASFLLSVPLGIATTVAVILHEIPQEIGDFAVLLHSGYSRKKALLYNFISALMAVVGVLFVFIFGSIIDSFVGLILPIAAGGFIYISIADLIPELHKDKNLKHTILQILIGAVGVFSMMLLTLLE
ncbi:MAG: ZIP family metal transporter [Candidatus Pacebacteria bacterium]|jgi:zinc and cadmium transporter|nr:ZIP family metal transporter [Candidatus Paceibacterota bacterium]